MGCGGSKEVRDPAGDDGLVTKATAENYERQETLGSGASSKVVSVREKRTKKMYAMKVLEKRDQENDFLFRNEVAILRVLDHPNIVRFKGSYVDTDTYHVLTTFCGGGDLFAAIHNMRVYSEREAVKLVRGMLRGIKYCHDHNVVHRDIKPENFVFKENDDNVILIDFGCAVLARDDEEIRDVAGSPYYVAPEVLEKGRRRTGRTWKASDMWSIGVIIFLLLHGYPPFNGINTKTIFARIKKGRYNVQKDNLSRQAVDLIQKLLQSKPENRLTAAEALRHPWVADDEAASANPLSKEIVDHIADFHAKQVLKKAVCRVMIGRMTKRDNNRLKALFDEHDLDGNGKLDANEVALMMQKMGWDEEDGKMLMSKLDEDGDGELDMEEFAVVDVLGRLGDKAKLAEEYKRIDKDGDGVITQDELTEYLKGVRTGEDAKKIFEMTDGDGDGTISFSEWAEAMGHAQGWKKK